MGWNVALLIVSIAICVMTFLMETLPPRAILGRVKAGLAYLYLLVWKWRSDARDRTKPS